VTGGSSPKCSPAQAARRGSPSRQNPLPEERLTPQARGQRKQSETPRDEDGEDKAFMIGMADVPSFSAKRAGTCLLTDGKAAPDISAYPAQRHVRLLGTRPGGSPKPPQHATYGGNWQGQGGCLPSFSRADIMRVSLDGRAAFLFSGNPLVFRNRPPYRRKT